jgi:Flp pilus assembly protein TadD
LALPEPDPQPRPSDASVPTEAVWDTSEQILQDLARIRQEQQSHERSSRRQHWSLAVLILIAIIGVAGLGWLGWHQWEAQTSFMTSPAILKARLQEEIDKTFATKLAALKAERAPPERIDKLYQWRDQTQDQLDQTVAFVQNVAEIERRSLPAQAARVLEERGMDPALALLDERLREEGERHKARARELAEAALFKAELHQTRFEYPQAQAALEQAIALDHGWWEPHNRLGMPARERADWERAERAFTQARLLVAKGSTDEAVVLSNLAGLLQATNRPAEAEPLMRRALVIVLKFTRDSGQRHPHLEVYFGNYRALLQAMDLQGERERRMASLVPEAGFDEDDLRRILEALEPQP